MNLDLPPDYRVRAPTAEDLDAVAEVLIADDLDAAGQRVLDAGFVQDQWSRVGFDLTSDAWVVVHRGEAIVAYGQARGEEPTVVEFWGVVHPGHRGRGIGSWLLDRIQQRASELLAGVLLPRFRHAVNAGDRAAAAMLQASACARSVTSGTCSWISPGSSRARRRRGSRSAGSIPCPSPGRPRRHRGGVRRPLGPPSGAVRPVGGAADREPEL